MSYASRFWLEGGSVHSAAFVALSSADFNSSAFKAFRICRGLPHQQKARDTDNTRQAMPYPGKQLCYVSCGGFGQGTSGDPRVPNCLHSLEAQIL